MAERNATEQITEKAEVWFGRAELEYQAGRVTQSQRCLERRWDYLCILADMQKTPKPKRPLHPSDFFDEIKTGTGETNTVAKPLSNKRRIKLAPPDIEGNTPTEKLANLAVAWFNRAALLYRTGRYNEARSHLRKRWACLCSLARLQNTVMPKPPREPEYYFGPRDDGPRSPDEPSGVPRRPTPSGGDTSQKLRLPKSLKNDLEEF